MVEFLRKFENRGIKIAQVNSILITKSINLQLFTLRARVWKVDLEKTYDTIDQHGTWQVLRVIVIAAGQAFRPTSSNQLLGQTFRPISSNQLLANYFFIHSQHSEKEGRQESIE